MFLDDDDIKAIRETFQYMDQDNGGDISTEELKEAYGLLNSKSW
jgi:Ca2+-binding EF-hand superfamily protein